MQEHAAVPKWDVKVLRELAQINYGRDAKPILDPYGAYPVYGTAESNRFGTSYLYDGDSVVLGRKGTIDRVQFVTGQFWTIDTAYFMSKFSECEPKWLYYVLSGVDLRSLNEATGVPSLAREVLYRLPILTPSPPEQSKIAEVLSTVDRAIAQTEALIDKQQRIKTGLMQDLLTRGIDEHGQLRSEATHAFKDSPLGRIPVEWEVSSVKSLLYKIEGGWSPSCIDEPPGQDEWGVLKVSAVSSGVYQPSESKRLPSALTPIPRLEVQQGDVLLCRANGVTELVGRCAYVSHTPTRLLLSDKTLRLLPILERVNPYIFSLLLGVHSSRLQIMASLSGSSGQKNISQAQIYSIQVRVPPRDEQLQLIAVLEKSTDRIRSAQESLSKLRHLKTSLMQDLLTGKVRVTTLLQTAEAAHA